jgi:hypothetical protein
LVVHLHLARFPAHFGLPQLPRAAEPVAATQFELDVSVKQNVVVKEQ